MSESNRQKVDSLRERLSPEKRAALARRLAAGTERAASAPTAPETKPGDDASHAGSFVEKVAAAARAAAVSLAPSPAVVERELATLEREDAYAIGLACQVLHQAGYRAGDACTAGELAERLRVRPLYRKLLARWMTELAGTRVLTESGGSLRLGDRFTEVLDQFPALAQGGAPAYWPQTCEHVVAVLRGQRHILELIDSGRGFFANAKQYHRESGRSQYFNGIAAAAIQAYAAATGEPPRVLEIGAGVGGTTGPVLEALPGDVATYEFTDLSNAFFDFARREFAPYPGVRYATLDMNRPPAAQGFSDESYDVVLGANSLHCAVQLTPSSRWMRGLLRPGGMLVIRELTSAVPGHMMLPGLVPGFSDFEDERLENNTPLLEPDGWRRALEAAGFERVAPFPSGGGCESLGEHVILAWRPPAPSTQEER